MLKNFVDFSNYFLLIMFRYFFYYGKVEWGQISIWKCEKNHKTQILLDLDEEEGGRNHTLGSKTKVPIL